MDGRPHPSPNAPHTFAGFTTGEWEGDAREPAGEPPADERTLVTPAAAEATVVVAFVATGAVVPAGVGAASKRMKPAKSITSCA